MIETGYTYVTQGGGKCFSLKRMPSRRTRTTKKVTAGAIRGKALSPKATSPNKNGASADERQKHHAVLKNSRCIPAWNGGDLFSITM
jgi:hypothetical protein